MILSRDYVYGLERKHYKYRTKIAKNVTEYIHFTNDGTIMHYVFDSELNGSRCVDFKQSECKDLATRIYNIFDMVYPQGGKNLIIGFCSDAHMLSMILDRAGVVYESYRRTETEYIYIKLQGTYFLQCDDLDGDADVIALHRNKIDEMKRTGILGLTTAAEIRNRIHVAFAKSQWTNDKIATLYINNYKMHEYIMHRIYRGGNCYSVPGEYDNVDMWDMDSAHLRQMLVKRYPTSGFEVVEASTLNDVRHYIKAGYAVICDVTFERIESRHWGLGVESKSTKEGVTMIDSARHVLKSERMTATLTEVDLSIYDMIYTWKKAKVNFCMIAKKNLLPAYLRNTIKELYLSKAEKKAAGLDYAEDKKRANMAYGACATKFDCRGIDQHTCAEVEYYNHKHRSELSPFWAVWTAAYTREAQCRLLSLTADFAIYGDTDSVYTKHTWSIQKVVENINNEIRRENNKLGAPEQIGTWELKIAKQLKVIGAKQYAYIDAEKRKTVIKSAGIAKEAFEGITYDKYNKGLTVERARRHIEDINGAYIYVYDDITIGEAIKLDELNYFIKRMYNRY